MERRCEQNEHAGAHSRRELVLCSLKTSSYLEPIKIKENVLQEVVERWNNEVCVCEWVCVCVYSVLD
jgi:hypothetical protein